MKQIFLLLSITTILFSGSGCQKNATAGKVRFTNNSSNPYTVYLDGTIKGTVNGNYSQDYSTTLGAHTARVVQNSGYLLYPTDKSYSVTVTSSVMAQVSFP